MAAAIKKAIEKDGLIYLLGWITNEIEKASQINISTEIDEDSTNQQVAGAKAVYDLVKDAIAGLTTIEMIVVDDLPAEGEPLTFYLIKVSDDPETYSQNIYIDGEWLTLGSTQVDLSGYWGKDELEFLTNTEIQEIIDEVMED